MDTEERDIFKFLKTWGTNFTSVKEVARRAASKKRFYDDPDWAKPILMRMEERNILENDIQGRYRIKPVAKNKVGKQWSRPTSPKSCRKAVWRLKVRATSPPTNITSNCTRPPPGRLIPASIPFKPRLTIQVPVRGCAA